MKIIHSHFSEYLVFSWIRNRWELVYLQGRPMPRGLLICVHRKRAYRRGMGYNKWAVLKSRQFRNTPNSIHIWSELSKHVILMNAWNDKQWTKKYRVIRVVRIWINFTLLAVVVSRHRCRLRWWCLLRISMNVSLAIEGQVYSRIQVKAKTEKKESWDAL